TLRHQPRYGSLKRGTGVATVSDVLRSASTDFVVHAGAAGLGREVRRILLVRPPGELIAPIGSDDLVVYAMAGAHGGRAEAGDRARASRRSRRQGRRAPGGRKRC